MENPSIFSTGEAQVPLGTYRGELRCGKPHGCGKVYDYKSGQMKFEGQWKYGFKCGDGKQYRVNEPGLVYEGLFDKDKYDGTGTFYFYNGYVYKGSFKENQFHGIARVYTPTGELTFCGLFKKHKKNGLGYQVYKGAIIEGYWEDDELVDTINSDCNISMYSLEDEFEMEAIFEAEEQNSGLIDKQANDIVIKIDAELEKMIRNNIGLGQNKPLTAGDMKSITEINDSWQVGDMNKKIESLQGLEYAINLTEFDFGAECLSDYIFELPDLSHSIHLRKINLTNSNISDVTNIARIPNLETLDLWYTNVSDIRPLANIKTLEYLTLPMDKVCQEDLEYLVQQNPNLNIFDYNDDIDDD